MNRLGLAEPKVEAKAGALLVARHVHSKDPSGQDSKGRPKFRTTNRLEVTNSGGTEAEGVTLRVVGEPKVRLDYDGKPSACSQRDAQLALHPPSCGRADLELEWTEGGRTHRKEQTVTLHN